MPNAYTTMMTRVAEWVVPPELERLKGLIVDRLIESSPLDLTNPLHPKPPPIFPEEIVERRSNRRARILADQEYARRDIAVAARTRKEAREFWKALNASLEKFDREVEREREYRRKFPSEEDRDWEQHIREQMRG